MADKTIGELERASELLPDSLLVVENGGKAQSLPGTMLEKFAERAGAKEIQRAIDAANDAETSAIASKQDAKRAEELRESIELDYEYINSAKNDAQKSADQALQEALLAEEAADLAQRIAQGGLGYYATDAILREKHPSAEDGNWAIVGSTDTIWVWDSDSGDWTNSGNKIDLSQYYTRTEVDDLLTGLEEKMTEDLSAATSKLYTVTVPASGWTAPGSPAPTWQGKTAKWVNTVSVPGMTDTANIPQGCVSFASGSYTAAEQWTWLEQGTDTVTFYADGAAAPAADFILRLTEVR